ncbi:MAG: 2-isopropylmalate synthase [Rickettsiales bacterium]
MTDRVIIFDTTLRDGEQSPGATMTGAEKLAIAETLDRMGVDVIEAGFARASEGDFAAVSAIAKKIKRATVCSLARSVEADIDAAAQAIAPAHKKRIHIFIATSALHMKYKLRMEPEDVLARVSASVAYARRLAGDVEWSAEDATRSDPDFLCRAVEAAIRAGATTVNIPDTVGYAVPEEYRALVASLIARVPNAHKAVFSTHCHNDLGLAVSNSLAGVLGGARQVECAVNGLGERAGNAALEEIVMAMKVRGDALPFNTGVDATHIMRLSRLVSTVTGFAVQKNKAIVGANAFAHESGIHQDGMLKHRGTYEIMTPASVGIEESTLALGKHSGRHAFRNKMEALGFVVEDEKIDDLFAKFKSMADNKKVVYDEDVIALVNDALTHEGASGVEFVDLAVRCGSKASEADLRLSEGGQEKSASRSGNGPVDAVFNAIRAIVPHEARLELYQVHAVTAGTDAQAEVTVRLSCERKTFTGHGRHFDTLVASAKAYLDAFNRMRTKK